MTKTDIIRAVAEAIDAGEKRLIGNHNLHSIFLRLYDSKMQKFYVLADYAHIDGIPLVWAARCLGYPIRRKHRVTYWDLLRPLLREAERANWGVFYLGSRPDVVDRAERILRSEFPNLEVSFLHGYYDVEPGTSDSEYVLDQIRESRPDLLLVGMGMPRQEHWIVNHFEVIESRVIMTCGAVMDLVVGDLSLPPRWIGALGFDSVYRLVSEPRRLFKRYVIEPWFILPLLLRDLIRRWR